MSTSCFRTLLFRRNWFIGSIHGDKLGCSDVHVLSFVVDIENTRERKEKAKEVGADTGTESGAQKEQHGGYTADKSDDNNSKRKERRHKQE